MGKVKWDSGLIPDQEGKVLIITGASSGLGKEAARVFAEKKATVILAVRNTAKGEEAAATISTEFPDAKLIVRKLDLTSLVSVKAFAEGIIRDFDRLDILINNAGIMMCPYSKTDDGFEIQMGTNHLGHFALTGLLMPLLKKTKGSRIIPTSSIAHNMGNINFSDINWEKRRYNTNRAYGDSKLANLYFTYELDRKLDGQEDAPKVIAAHPGVTQTELMRHSKLFRLVSPLISQKVEDGTLPTLRAATDPEAKSGDYYGPGGFKEMRGHPVRVDSNKRSKEEAAARRLWELSEELTGVRY
ncbi:MAG: SDR family oxidoreductase [Bacteroidales bacterium]|nr:SDR family oxidoreductase [Bacteroidales bacterium]